MRLSGMTRVNLPPRRPATSYTVASWPLRRSCQATDSPAGPPPTTAMRRPLSGGSSGSFARMLAWPIFVVSTGAMPPICRVQDCMQRFGQR